MNVEKVCRVCISEFDELTPLWVKLPGENKTLEETINFVVNINIKLENGVPYKICKICESVLDLADTFKQRCLESESILEQKTQEKRSEESRSYDENNYQVNIEIKSEDNSCFPTIIPHTSLTDSLSEITEKTGNIYDLPEHKIKVEIEEHHVEPGLTISAQDSLDTIKDEKPKEPLFKQCLIKEEFSAETIKNKELFSCSHCNLTFESKMLYKVHILLVQSSFIPNKGAPSSKKPKLDDIQPTTAAERSPTEDPAAADTSTDTVIETEANFDKAENFGVITKKKHGKNLKLKGAKIISKGKVKKVSTKDTATMLKLSGTNTDDRITGATETQSKCISNIVIGPTGDILTCDICGYTTATVKNLNSHLKAHAATKRYCCDSCLYLTVNSVNFNRHLRSHTDADDKPFSCDECKKKFSRREHLVTHLKTHTSEKSYSCDICEKNFAQKSYLVIHRRTHTGERPYSCNICEKKFTQSQHLIQHLRIHIGERPYSCDICQKKFVQKKYLVAHNRIHTGETPFSCDMCDMKFIRKDSLVAHASTHTGDKPYSCDVCEMKFINKSNLNRHARIHTGEKPFSCNVCVKRFSNKQHLVSHLRTHTGEKPYSCNMCEWKFSKKYHLLRHITRAHSFIKKEQKSPTDVSR